MASFYIISGEQYEEYKEKIGTIINGTVKRVEFGNVIIDMGKTEAVLRRDEIIPRENFKNGDRVPVIVSKRFMEYRKEVSSARKRMDARSVIVLPVIWLGDEYLVERGHRN